MHSERCAVPLNSRRTSRLPRLLPVCLNTSPAMTRQVSVLRFLHLAVTASCDIHGNQRAGPANRSATPGLGLLRGEVACTEQPNIRRPFFKLPKEDES